MVERNAPCPCGSGKKYKKCCALKENTALDELVEKELRHVVMGYPEKLFSDREWLRGMHKMTEQWEEALGQHFNGEEIETLAFDYYLFVTQREQWRRHVLKEMNGTIRSLTRSTLAEWLQPILLIGKVIEGQGDYYKVEEVLGHQTYQVRKNLLPRSVPSDLIISIALRDAREIENGLYIFNDVTGVHDENGDMMRSIQQLAESSGQPNLLQFFDEHMLDVYALIFGQEMASVQEIIEKELTTSEQAVCHLLAVELESMGVPQMEIEVGQMVAMSYLRRENPRFRKPEIIAAAVFKAMENYGVIEFTYDFSQKEVAEMYGVSVTSMAKHIEPVEDILEFMIEELEEEPNGPTVAYHIGTDPQITERANWEIVCRIEELDPDSVEDIQLFMNQNVNERFIPKGKEQKAQAYAYDAYEQENEEARVRLATVAYFTNPNNVDALLLRAEHAEEISDARRDFEQAIGLGKLAYDEDFEDTPWGIVTNRPYMRAIFSYGIYLMEIGEYDEALNYFEQLLEINPNDNQGVRHPAIATAIHAGDYTKATELVEQFAEQPIDQAVYHYLKWLFDTSQGKGSNALGAAIELNPHLSDIIKENHKQYSYPRQVAVVPGSMEEALYIAFLIWPSWEREF